MIFSSFGFIGTQGLDVEYLIVGGGANGGASNGSTYYGFGGGAGGFVSQRATLTPNTAFPVVVGLGGNIIEEPGQSSSFAGDWAGGGAGPMSGYPQYNVNSSTGSECGVPPFLHKVGGGGAAEAGFAPYCVGGPDPTGTGNNGGAGLMWLDGNYYAGGGGGGIQGKLEYVATGGLGGGGNGGYEFAAPSGAVANTGGGGGGGGSALGGDAGAGGGSGIVKIRYAGTGSRATGGTISYTDGYTYHTFTSSATFTTL